MQQGWPVYGQLRRQGVLGGKGRDGGAWVHEWGLDRVCGVDGCMAQQACHVVRPPRFRGTWAPCVHADVDLQICCRDTWATRYGPSTLQEWCYRGGGAAIIGLHMLLLRPPLSAPALCRGRCVL